MVWGAVIGAGLSIASGVMSNNAAKDSARAARQTARFNAENIEAETAESIRRMDIQNEQVLGSMQAIMGASGVLTDNGTANYNYVSMETEQLAQREWAQESGDRQAAIVRRGGQLQSSSIQANQWAANTSLAANTWMSLSSSFRDYQGSTS